VFVCRDSRGVCRIAAAGAPERAPSYFISLRESRQSPMASGTRIHTAADVPNCAPSCPLAGPSAIGVVVWHEGPAGHRQSTPPRRWSADQHLAAALGDDDEHAAPGALVLRAHGR
jgi:hypothetical protein